MASARTTGHSSMCSRTSRRRMPATDRRPVMRQLILLLVGAFSMAAPAPAHADWFVAPFAGGNFKGDATHKNRAVGIAGGWVHGWVGVEGDFGWAPEFFAQDGFKTAREVTTVMGNAIVAVP